MSDKLKLADGHGDAEIEKISQAKEMDELNRRIQELEQNVARLKALQVERERAAGEAVAPKAAGSNKIGARKHAGFKAISTAPSINKTPIGPSMVPLPYPTVQDLSNSTSTARSVRFNGAPAYLLDGTTQPKCTGDEPGTGKGIRSGTVSGEVKPVKGSSTVRIEGKQVVREGDACTMNGGNNPGIYVTTQAPSSAPPKDAIKTSHPPTTLDTPEEKSAFRKWLAQAEDDIRQAAKHPVEGVKGAAKGIVNIVPGTMELLLKVSAEQRATELDESAMTLGIFGQTGAATTLSEAASGARKNADTTDLPKVTMSNQAQKGGDTISTAIQLFAAGVGIVKGGAKLLGGLGKAGKAAKTAKAAEVASGTSKIDKATGAAAGPTRDGVKIARKDGATGTKTNATNTSRTIDGALPDGLNPVPKKKFSLWMEYLSKRGVIFEIGTDKAYRILAENDAMGLFEKKLINIDTNTFQRTIYLRENPNASTFYEEGLHALDSIKGRPGRMDLDGLSIDAYEYRAKTILLDASPKRFEYEELQNLERDLELVKKDRY
ncbi:hypothetical protein CSQ96_12190 [Janthinobacterium sp. BJB412]|nr:hypothetical protein CSQ96_12190 [Janthinobacterium sp. BJB412]